MRVGRDSMREKRFTLAVSILQVTISNQVCKIFVLKSCLLFLILKMQISPDMVNVVGAIPLLVRYRIGYFLGRDP